MKFLSRMLAAVILAASAGCGLRGPLLVDPFLGEEISGGDFDAQLAREYQRRTGLAENVHYAGRMARKGYAAMRGESVLPWDPADWNLRTADTPELQTARARLMSALDGGGRQQFPEPCAKAQVAYDAWLEQAHEKDSGPFGRSPGTQPDYAAPGKAAFYEVMSLCEGVIDPNKFVIYFGWNRLNLTDAASELVSEIAGVAERFNANVLVEAYSDSSGAARYNMRLSEKRARAVAEALQERGVVVSGVRWFGEKNPAVPRGDRVREPLNRRVEVILTR